MNVYIEVDIEGVAGVVFYEHRHKDMSLMNFDLLRRNRVLMTEEVNAAARGAFDAGAESVIVYDHHGEGYNLMPELLEKRVELIHGRAEQGLVLGQRHPDLDESIDALVLVGMHAKAGTRDGGTPHSLICVDDGAGKRHELSEATMAMALAGDVNVPTVFVSGDRATVEDALLLAPNMAHIVTKRHYASQFARTITPALSRERIQAGVREGIARRDAIAPFRIPGPCAIRIADRKPCGAVAGAPQHPAHVQRGVGRHAAERAMVQGY